MSEVHHLSDEAYKRQKAAVWRATIIMAVVTVLEVTAALNWPDGWPRMLLNLLFILMSAVKAFFIIGEFMHLKYEVRALIISIIAPCFFLIWFIIAFMWEGSSWLHLREFWHVF